MQPPAVPVGLPDADALGEVEPEGEADADGDEEADALGLALADADADAVAEADGLELAPEPGCSEITVTEYGAIVWLFGVPPLPAAIDDPGAASVSSPGAAVLGVKPE